MRVGGEAPLHVEPEVREEQMELVPVVLPVVTAVRPVPGVRVVDVRAGHEAQHVVEPVDVRRGEDEPTPRPEDAVDLAQHTRRVHEQVFDDLAEHHDVEGVVGPGKHIFFEVEVCTRELALGARAVGARVGDRLGDRRPGILGAEVVRQLELELGVLGEHRGDEVRVGAELECAALEVVNEIPGVQHAEEAVFEVVAQLGDGRAVDRERGEHLPHCCFLDAGRERRRGLHGEHIAGRDRAGGVPTSAPIDPVDRAPGLMLHRLGGVRSDSAKRRAQSRVGHVSERPAAGSGGRSGAC